MSQQVTGPAGRQSQWCTVKTALILPRQPLPWFWERCSRISSLGNSPGSSPRPRGGFQGEGVCVRSSLPPARHRAQSSPGRRVVTGVLGQLDRAAAPGAASWRLCPQQHRPRLSSRPSIRALSRDSQNTALHPVPVAFAHPRDGKRRHVSTESGSCPPPLPLSCPGLRPEGLAGSSNLICFRSQATQRAFVRPKCSTWSSDLQPVAHSPQWSPCKLLVEGT